MNTPAPSNPPHDPEMESDVVYTLDVVARVSGVSSQTVLHYHEQGLMRPITKEDSGGGRLFDDETVHRLRRIEHLRSTYGMDLSALKLTLNLMDEVERLRSELRLRS